MKSIFLSLLLISCFVQNDGDPSLVGCWKLAYFQWDTGVYPNVCFDEDGGVVLGSVVDTLYRGVYKYKDGRISIDADKVQERFFRGKPVAGRPAIYWVTPQGDTLSYIKSDQ